MNDAQQHIRAGIALLEQASARFAEAVECARVQRLNDISVRQLRAAQADCEYAIINAREAE